MIYLHWAILIIYVATIISAMTAVLMDNRQPAKTVAWLLVLLFIPLIGIVLYYFFGQNTRKEKYISQRSLDQLTKRSMLSFVEQRDLQLPEKHNTLIRQFTQQNWALPFKNNNVEIFTDGFSFFTSLLKAIGQARHHIHLSTYIIENDPLGQLIADALIDRAKQGVEVRLIYDDVGCWRVPNSFFERMRSGGIDVHAFMPVHFPAFTSKVNYRNHRKLCIIDGELGFIGGMNIAMRYLRGTTRSSWRDTHLLVRGGAVYGIQRAFLVDWYFVDRTLVSGEEYYPEQPTTDTQLPTPNLAQVVTSSPIAQWPDIMQGYVRILLEAKQYVYMETPYFLPTEPILFAMRTAALAGVDVRLMVPTHPDSRLLEWASRSYLVETLDAGVKVYLYEAGFNHSKLLVADDSLCTCGSTNIDFRSFENNFEANIFFYDETMAMRMKKVFLDDQEHCSLVDEQTFAHRRPFVHRLWESLIRLLSPLL
ncbi:MAG: cardiolipin synthase [Prevotella sp.]|nr:cardiolipin synthase [Prevotella sp.]